MTAISKESAGLFVGYSIKNRKFTRDFFVQAGLFAKENAKKLLVGILDVPYAHNIAGFDGRELPTPEDYKACLEIGSQREKMARRVLLQIPGLSFEIRRWDKLETPISEIARTEIVSAVARYPRFKMHLGEYAAVWLRSVSTTRDASDFIGFQVEELPVLIEIFYRQKYLCEIYPDLLNDFFSRLEAGFWAHELPFATSLAAGKRLISLTPDQLAGKRQRRSTNLTGETRWL